MKHLIDIKAKIHSLKLSIADKEALAIDFWLDGNQEIHDEYMRKANDLKNEVKSLEMEIEYRQKVS